MFASLLIILSSSFSPHRPIQSSSFLPMFFFLLLSLSFFKVIPIDYNLRRALFVAIQHWGTNTMSWSTINSTIPFHLAILSLSLSSIRSEASSREASFRFFLLCFPLLLPLFLHATSALAETIHAP